MLTSITALNNDLPEAAGLLAKPKSAAQGSKASAKDVVEFGKGKAVSNNDAMNMVVERALDKLRSVVSDARKELGLPEDAEIDTSPDATADRIVGFALGFWDKYAKQHGLEDTEEGRQAFADFIGGAINKGIGEARGILTALSALSPEIDDNINKTSDIIQNRLKDFVSNGLLK